MTHAVGCSAKSVLARCIAGSPSRRPGNFLLRGQKKVTKEEALNRTPARRRHERRAKTASGLMPRRDPLRSRCCPYHQHQSPQQRAAERAAARRAHQKTKDSVARATRRTSPFGTSPQRRGIPDKPGVQPALTVVKWRSVMLVIGTAARAQRVACGHGPGPSIASACQHSSADCIQRSSFGDFSLARQRKVTRHRGADSRGTAPGQKALRKSKLLTNAP